MNKWYAFLAVQALGLSIFVTGCSQPGGGTNTTSPDMNGTPGNLGTTNRAGAGAEDGSMRQGGENTAELRELDDRLDDLDDRLDSINGGETNLRQTWQQLRQRHDELAADNATGATAAALTQLRQDIDRLSKQLVAAGNGQEGGGIGAVGGSHSPAGAGVGGTPDVDANVNPGADTSAPNVSDSEADVNGGTTGASGAGAS